MWVGVLLGKHLCRRLNKESFGAVLNFGEWGQLGYKIQPSERHWSLSFLTFPAAYRN